MDAVFLALTGQEWLVVKHQLLAICENLLSWLLVLLGIRRTKLTLDGVEPSRAAAVQILSPGGYERFHLADLDEETEDGVLATVGYNVRDGVQRVPGCNSLVRVAKNGRRGVPPDCVLVDVAAFSVNYADVTIRWGAHARSVRSPRAARRALERRRARARSPATVIDGAGLYESAIRYVGYPIVPGFDFAGTVVAAGARARAHVGERVLGVTFFGAYTSRLLVPARQVRATPASLSDADAAALSSVAGTALHALALAGFWPSPPLSRNRAVLVHSAAGGVGSMLVQMARLLGCEPVVGVVGAPHKSAVCEALGAHVVIDKSSTDLWVAAERAAPGGYAAVFDANGVATLAQSYAHLARTGRLVVYGFHTNLPSSGLLNPLAWARMALALFRLPRFDPLDLVLNSRSVHGFNLSFFAEEQALLDAYMDQILAWARDGKLALAKVTNFAMREAPLAHDLIQSGQSVGKIVCAATTSTADEHKRG